MKITIDIPDMYVERLSKWASVSRTLNEAKDILESVECRVGDDDCTADRVQACHNELRDITPALNELHQVARNMIWEMKEKK